DVSSRFLIRMRESSSIIEPQKLSLKTVSYDCSTTPRKMQAVFGRFPARAVSVYFSQDKKGFFPRFS
ncbi:MAG: hypothetical protein PUD44_04215, partial [Clostridiaceae bacterium]|nr:hypothetical protein [Clostridiaceae bacterium]